MSRRAGLLQLAGWTVGIVAVLAAVTASGHGPLSPPPLGSPDRWPAWLEQRDPTTAAFALLRLAVLGGCWYLAATTVLGGMLRLMRADVLVAVADRVTVAPVRRILAGSLTLTLAGIGPTGMVAAYAQTTTSPTTSTTTTSTSTSTSTSLPVASTLATITMIRLPPPGTEPDGPPAEAPTVAEIAGQWTVQPGDCFWTIAEDLLQRSWSRPPTDAEIVPYWLRLIEANRAELVYPNNADLIFPAQVFTVPPVPPAGAG